MSMNVGGRRCIRAGAIGLVAIAAMCGLAWYRGAFTAAHDPHESEWQRAFWNAVAKAEPAFEAGNWPQAARQYAEITRLLPYDPVSRQRRATALAHLGREDEAFEELILAVEFGWADIEALQSEPAFAPIRATPRFKKLLERASTIADEPIVVYVPQDLDTKSAAPLVITFHGLGENPHRHIRSWQQAADRLGAVIAAPRGIERIGRSGGVHAFRWVTAGGRADGDALSRCRDLLERTIELARQRARIDERRIALAGYSQGGSVALALLADAPERFCGAVVQATAYSARTLATWKPGRPAHSPRVSVILHEFDRMRPKGEEAFDALRDAGIDARLTVVPGADHEWPLDNTPRQIEAVRFVLGRAAAGPP